MRLSLHKKSLTIFSIITILTMFGTTIALAAPLLNLPATPVTATHGPWNGNGIYSTLAITLSNVPAGFDVTNKTYNGWCVEDNHQSNAPQSNVILLEATGAPWDKINWLINNRTGYGAMDVQIAIWILTGTLDSGSTANAVALAAAANANGGGFVPGPGQLVAVRVINDNAGDDQYQDTIIEVPLPPDDGGGGEGCTPGYWRNHEEDWPATGYSWTADFDATFGGNLFNPNITLGQAIWLGGGGVKALARHGTAALLSAAHPDVDYPYTVAQVIAMVQAGETAKLSAANELGCKIP